jgi:hypothetical protein
MKRMLLTSCFHQLKQASDNASLLLVGLGYDRYMCTWLWKVFRNVWAQWSGQCGAAIVDNGWWSERKLALMPQDVHCNSRIRSWGFETWQMVFTIKTGQLCTLVFKLRVYSSKIFPESPLRILTTDLHACQCSSSTKIEDQIVSDRR